MKIDSESEVGGVRANDVIFKNPDFIQRAMLVSSTSSAPAAEWDSLEAATRPSMI
jgi:hypothetical protein